MKHHLSFLILILLLPSCVKEQENVVPGPVKSFGISFILVDSLGNNVLPYELPPNPIVDPDQFTASSDISGNIGHYYRNQEVGHFFIMGNDVLDIQSTFTYMEDSTFYFYPCFGEQCDTVQVLKKGFFNQDSTASSCYADRIVWSADTFYNYYCGYLPISID
jgi:hypothetical protein